MYDIAKIGKSESENSGIPASIRNTEVKVGLIRLQPKEVPYLAIVHNCFDLS
jgi:hypothetical protein